jgi:hypothetical protein
MPIFHKDTCTKWEEMPYGVDKTTIDDEVTSSMNNIIKTENVTVDLCFHPTKDVLAAGDIEGEVKL